MGYVHSLSVPALLGAAVLLLGLPRFAAALGIRLLHQDPEAVARGNAFVATANNPSAIYYNPAGITQLTGEHLQVGVYSIAFDARYKNPDNRTFDTPDRFIAAAQVFYTGVVKDSRVSYGFGLYSPYGLGTEWSEDSPFRSFATRNELIFVSANPVVAVRLSPSFSVAAGFIYNYAHTDLRRGIFVPGDELRFVGDGHGVGCNLGLLWQPHPQHWFGLTYRSSSRVKFEGDLRLRLIVPAAISSREGSELSLDFPQQVSAGYSFRPSPAWNLEVNLDWTDWDSLNRVTVTRAAGDLVEAFDWESSCILSFGATHTWKNGLAISGGYFFSESSTPDATFNPRVADLDLHVFSLGTSFRTERWRIACTYHLGYGPENGSAGSARSPLRETVDGAYRFTGHGVALSFEHRF